MHIRKPLPEELPGLPTLIASTVFAIACIAALIVTVILPAERGIDPTGIGDRLGLTRMGILKIAMSEPDAPLENRPAQSDETVITLTPNQGREVKMEMSKGFEANYQWQTSGGPVYHDTHGDPYSDESVYVTYSKARSVENDTGSIKAIYGGYHGWYWVNKGSELVTITLNTQGEYIRILVK